MMLPQLRERAVDEFEQFFASSVGMLSIADLSGRIHRMNDAWQKTLGFSCGELSIAKLLGLVHPDDRDRAAAAVAALKAGSDIDQAEIRLQSSAGDYKWLAFTAKPARGDSLVFIVAFDITDRKRLEAQLQQRNLVLEQQNRAIEAASRTKSEFLANMSHELRSPLNGIIGYSEIMHDGRLGPMSKPHQEALSRVLNSSRHLLKLINEILDLSKVEAGRFEVCHDSVDVPGLVREVVCALLPLASEKQIRIETRTDPEIQTVVTDPGRLKQILYNYVSNALKFTPKGGEIVVAVRAEGATEFRLEVIDTGVGIKARDLPRLFVEFQQLDSSAARRAGGTGLGLALTRRIVEALGGTVGVTSTPGAGSTFFAVMPRVGRPANTGAPAAAPCEKRGYDLVTMNMFLPVTSSEDLRKPVRRDEGLSPVERVGLRLELEPQNAR